MNVLRPSRARFVIALLLPVLAFLAMAAPAAAQQDFYTVPLCRAYDSRGGGGPLDPGTVYTVTLAGVCGVPANAAIVALNVTIISPEAGTLVTFPAGGTPPSGSPPPDALVFRAGRTQAKNYQVSLGAGGAVSFRADTAPGNPDIYHAIIDVAGYYLSNTTVVDDAATVAEDAAPTAIDVLANDTDPDDTLTIASATDPAHGTVVLTGGAPGAHTGLTYQPDADYCGTDNFNYTVNPSGDIGTVTVTVTCVNDDPVAVDDAATVLEDAAATAVNVLANDTDVENDPFTIASATDPAHGTVVVAGDGLSLTYQPDANYCGPDTFDYTLTPGGDTATVTMTVDCVEGAPVAVDDVATVAEDASATMIDVLANDTDDEGDPFTIASATDPAHGTVVVAGDGLSLTYQPDANYCGPDTFDYTLTPGGDTATVSVTVTCVNDNPVAVDDATTVAEDALATAIDVLANDTDTESDAFTIASATDPAHGTVMITGGGTGLTYQPDANYCGADTFDYTLTPGGDTATVTVTVTCVNDDPIAQDDAATVAEDAPATALPVLVNDSDPENDAFTIASATDPAHGTVVITGGGTGLTYQPDANYCGTDTFDYTLTPGSDSATVVVTVNCVDDAPVAVDDVATVAEDAPATAIPVLANDTDAENDAFTIASATDPAHGTVMVAGDGLSLTYQPDANYCGADTFNYTLTPGGDVGTVAVTVTCVDDTPVAVDDAATITEDASATAIPILANDTDLENDSFTIGSATDPANGTVMVAGDGLSLTYQPDTNYCGADTFNYTLNPGGDIGTVVVTVTCVDDPPVAVDDAATVTEDDPATAIPVLANDTDIDAGPKTIASATDPAHGTVIVTGGGTGLTYQPDANYCGSDTFNYTLTPGGDVGTVVITVTCVPDPPLAGTDNFETFGNTELRVDLSAAATPHVLTDLTGASGVLNNDSDPIEMTPITLTNVVGCADLTAPFVCATVNGGQVTLEADGSFSYLPPRADPAVTATDSTDSFQYTLTNGVGASAIGTVNLTRREVIWYVDPTAAAGGDGRSHSPLQNFASLNGVAGAGDFDNADDFIAVHDGTFAGNASIELEAGQRLIGQGVAFSLPLGSLGTKSILPATTQPQITNASGDVIKVTAAVPARIAGLSLSGSVNAIDMQTTGAYSGSGTLAIENNTFRGAGAEGIDVNAGATGTLALNIQNNTWNVAGTHAGNAIDVATTNGALRLDISNNSNVLSTGASAIVAGAASPGTLTITGFANNTVHQNTAGNGISINAALFDATPGGAVNRVYGGSTRIGTSGDGVGATGLSLTNVTGDLAFGDELTVGDLDVYSLGAALTATSTVVSGVPQFRLTVTPPANGGSSTLVATGGAAVDIDSVTADLRLSGLTSTNGLKGVSLVRVLPGSFPAQFHAPSGSSITTSNAGATAFRVDQSNAAVTYQGTITATAGTGVSLTSNTGSTMDFTGTLTLSTGASPAFAATGGGTVTSTNTASTLTTTTATALNVANTTIGAGGLKFQSISSNGGGSSGIVLNNTGSSGGLTVSGNGGSCTSAASCTGGAIQGKTVDGILLNNTRGVSLTRMFIDNNDGSGIFGDDVTDFSLVESRVSNNTDATGGAEAGLRFNELLGNCAITNTTIRDNYYDNVRITPASGVLSNLAISGVTVGPNDAAVGNNGITILPSGSADVTVNVTGSTFQSNRASAFLANATTTTGKLTVSVTGSNFNDNNIGLDLLHAQSGDFTFTVSGNTFIGNDSNTINFSAASTSTNAGQVVGTIASNTIGNGTPDSGSRDAYGIGIDAIGDVDMVLAITNNVVRNTDFEGIFVESAFDDTDADAERARLDLTLTGNTVGRPDDNSAFPFGIMYGVRVEARHTSTLCLDMSGNTAASVGGVEHFRVRQRNTAAFIVERLTDGDATPNEVITNLATVESFIAGQNAAGSTADATNQTAGVTGFTEAANGFCRQP